MHAECALHYLLVEPFQQPVVGSDDAVITLALHEPYAEAVHIVGVYTDDEQDALDGIVFDQSTLKIHDPRIGNFLDIVYTTTWEPAMKRSQRINVGALIRKPSHPERKGKT